MGHQKRVDRSRPYKSAGGEGRKPRMYVAPAQAHHCRAGGSSSSGGTREIETEGKVETSAWSRSVWVYGDGNEMKAVRGPLFLLSLLVLRGSVMALLNNRRENEEEQSG